MPSRRHLLLPVLAVTLAGVVMLSMMAGKGLDPATSARTLFSSEPGTPAYDILWKVRLPRILLGLLVGAGLACAGGIFQGMLRNPLADPFTLGISGGAALGATAVRILWANAPAAALPTGAFLGAGLAALMVYAAASRTRFTESGLILAGVVLSFFFSSLVYLLFALARPSQAHGALMWLMGDLSYPQPGILMVLAPPILLATATAWIFARDLDTLTLGDDKAASLGVSPARTRQILFALASLITASCVAGAGVVGFVGLMIPHFLRPFSGPGHRLLLPACALGGAVLLVSADTFARAAVPSLDLPVGVITGLMGGLFMLALLGRGRAFRFF